MTLVPKEVLVRGLSDKDREIIVHQLQHSLVLDKVREFLQVKKRELIVRQSDYDNPAWLAKQAHQNGLFDAYTQIETLLSLDQKET